MKVVRVVGYHQNLKLEEAPEPEITSPMDVIVRIGAAGGIFAAPVRILSD
jgi:NAD+-dependent secondary alcohol dehydrogenase Adh1